MLRIESLFGAGVLAEIRNRVVTDYGCGEGHESLELAQNGASTVFGIDIRPNILDIARRNASSAGVQNLHFTDHPPTATDLIFSIDSFEHFGNPAEILEIWASFLKPDGKVLVSFGPPWFHPRGGHFFSFFPWAHILLPEGFLCRWRARYKTDGAMRFCEVEGGLNQMSIRRFENLVRVSPFFCRRMQLIPIRPARWLHCRWTREFFTSIVQCELVLRRGTAAVSN